MLKNHIADASREKSSKLSLFQMLQIISVGFAIFAMIFGAGNVAFPFLLGETLREKSFWGILGLFLTGVAMPFLGVVVMVMFDGSYSAFFGRLGRKVSLIVSVCLMALLGPFNATPRCLTLAASTFQESFPSLPYYLILGAMSALVLLAAWRKDLLLSLLGSILTPVLLTVILILVVKGFLTPPAMLTEPTALNASQALGVGLDAGYNMLDLIAVLFYAVLIIPGLEKIGNCKIHTERRKITNLAIKASIVGGIILTLAYVFFVVLASRFSAVLQGYPTDKLLGIMSNHIFGRHGGAITNLIIVMACLMTSISQTTTFARFGQNLINNKIKYHPLLIITLLLAVSVATLGFDQIVQYVLPILKISYPPLIALTIFNLLHKLVGFKAVRLPVFLVFIGAVFMWFFK